MRTCNPRKRATTGLRFRPRGYRMWWTAEIPIGIGIITPTGGRLVHQTATCRCDDTRGCVMQFWPPDYEHMCSKHVEAWNKLIIKQKFCASSWLITEINILRCMVSKTSKFVYQLCPTLLEWRRNQWKLLSDTWCRGDLLVLKGFKFCFQNFLLTKWNDGVCHRTM